MSHFLRKGLKHITGSPEPTSVAPVSTDTTDARTNVDDIDEEGDEQHNILMGIITQLRPGSDLSRITLPTFILERKSMLERITNQLCHPQLLLDAHMENDELLRMLKVVKWYLSGWHIAPKAVKKPLNPILNEFFTCYWDMPDGSRAYYLAEQTSHHPPMSAYFYCNPSNHIRVDGVLLPKSRFLGNSAASLMEGIATLSFTDRLDADGSPEAYDLTQPNIYARGILFGKLKYELGDHSFIYKANSNLVADIEFKTKGFISGTYNAIEGRIYDKASGIAYFEISGKWNEVMTYKDLRTNKTSVLFDTFTEQPVFPKVRPINEQHPRESRRLWKRVTDALANRDHTTATDEKFKIEEQQRKEAKERDEQGVEITSRYFKRNPSNAEGAIPFILAKTIDGKTPEEQEQQILSISPFVDGQKPTIEQWDEEYLSQAEFVERTHSSAE
ncbi:hypothetical protein CANCADRAFT_139680 [Tortispora caseinolytica NRRL Y-17796]|uniref:Oxysterol-binding protein n=1 Tax=Tortispora caseinolytica NRRL Y-17796 TaxID=767744 RepID=A0A1E4TCK3_9ASCO|nr:hypothetical protein CANCADRAFT_139680 [Tortispora caseinolytica NRRL Y-17796]